MTGYLRLQNVVSCYKMIMIRPLSVHLVLTASTILQDVIGNCSRGNSKNNKIFVKYVNIAITVRSAMTKLFYLQHLEILYHRFVGEVCISHLTDFVGFRSVTGNVVN